jgi:DNA-binding HxlR family transcriptional regulator
MNGYGQFCPIAKACEVIGERWSILVLRELAAGSHSFNDIRRGLPLMSPSLLSTRLKSLEKHGIIVRNEKDGGVSYALSSAGEELKPIILSLGTWGQRWVRSDLSKDDLDPSLLMWDIHRSMNTDSLPGGRTVFLFEFKEYTSKLRRWWLVVTDGEVDVCIKDPGYEVDLHVLTDVKTLTGYWMGSISLTAAQRTDKLTLMGSSQLKKTVSSWLGKNYFSVVKAAKK